MAAYLNRLDFVSVLVEKGDSLVLVDGIDCHRATPLMYAARDGHIEVLNYLIRQGARPDLLDCHHRSVLFYAVSHPQCLLSCEKVLRLRRAELLLSHKKKRNLKLTLQHDVNTYISLAAMYQQYSSKDLTSSVQLLVNAVRSSDPHAVHSLLFPPINRTKTSSGPALVNLPDKKGLSPIHYCVTASQPSTKVLDVLFLAGADLALYTTDNAVSPLHLLARAAVGEGASFRLYTFVVHLVRDLGAPLDAVDSNGDSCLHVAAQHGRYVDVLMAFLECDPDCVVRKIRNNAGQTALDVAKAEFRVAFEPDEDGSARPGSASSMRTIKASFSSSSLTSSYSSLSSDSSSSMDEDIISHEQFPPAISHEKETLRAVLGTSVEVEQLLKDLGGFSEQLARLGARKGDDSSGKSVDLDKIEAFMHSNGCKGSEVLERFRQLVEAEVDDMQAAREVYTALDQLIARLERRIRVDTKSRQAELEERERAQQQTPALPALRVRTSYATLRSNAATPALVASGSSSSSHSSFASFMSLTDRAALMTPAGSPRSVHAERELDFACALAAGSATRLRRASSLGTVLDFASPDSSLEDGVNLFSVPTERAPEVDEVVRSRRESWLNPYVRKANSNMFQAHLENLLEIEKTLFGAEDAEREMAPNPSLGLEVNESWRDVVETLHEDEEEGIIGDDDGTFLEMADANDADLDGPIAGDGIHDSADEFLDLFVTPFVGEFRELPTNPEEFPVEQDMSHGPPSALEVLELARKEALAIEEAMKIAERSIKSAEHYINRAECLTSKIFQANEHAIQAVRLSRALSGLSFDDEDSYRRGARSFASDDYTPTPASSPIVRRMRGAPLHSPPTASSAPTLYRHAPRQSSVQSIQSLASPTFPTSPPPSLGMHNAAVQSDVRALRRLLLRKIPSHLDGAIDGVDKVASWVGVVHAIARNVQQTRL
ncbi:hypothetical protein EW145_g8112 [Phellinidium pouzarii]|uniref:Uncharacterized protein n=1 Tax=Phellinidium pouzarii TaxID=167371 RepID=A0A4S4K9I2_9AGAM|nr:hypothetical protein EW145_g8112 [Phellinidium pouzarii]